MMLDDNPCALSKHLNKNQYPMPRWKGSPAQNKPTTPSTAAIASHRKPPNTGSALMERAPLTIVEAFENATLGVIADELAP